jgi:hypothetical protein
MIQIDGLYFDHYRPCPHCEMGFPRAVNLFLKTQPRPKEGSLIYFGACHLNSLIYFSIYSNRERTELIQEERVLEEGGE